MKKVTVEYSTDTSDLVKGLDKAIADNERLAKAVAKLNAELADVGKTAKATGDAEAKAFDKSAEAVDGLNDKLGQTDKALDEVDKSAKKTGDTMDKSAKKQGTSIQQTMGGLSGLKSSLVGIAGTLGIAFGVKELVNFGKEAILTAARVEGVRHAFSQLNDPTLLDQLREATQGTADDMTLMTAAVRAKNFNIPLQDMGKYLQFAQLRAQQTGESVEYMTESIITGLARQSIPILDNLGLSAVELNKEAAKTGSIFSAAGAIIDRLMAQSGKAIETTGTVVERLNTKWSNVKTTIGDALIASIRMGESLVKGGLQGLNTDIAANNAKLERDYKDEKLKIEAKSYTLSQLETAIAMERLNNNQHTVKVLEQFLSQKKKEAQLDVERKAQSVNNLNLAIEGLTFEREKLDVIKDAARIRQINIEILQKQRLIDKASGKEEAERLKAAQEAAKRLRAVNKANAEEEAQERKVLLEEGAKEVEELLLLSKEKTVLLGLDRQAAEARRQLVSSTDELGKLEAKNTLAYIEAEKKKRELIAESSKAMDGATTEEEQVAVAANLSEQLAAIDADYNKEIQDNAEATQEKLREDQKKTTEATKEELEQRREAYQSLFSSIAQLSESLGQATIENAKATAEKETEALDKQFESGVISKKTYEAKKAAIDEEVRKREIAIKRRQAIFEKAQAIYTIVLETQKNAVKYAENPILLALTLTAGAIAAAAVAAQPLPKFAKGTSWVDGNGFPNGIDTVPALLTKGERVIPRETNIRYYGDLEAIAKGKVKPGAIADNLEVINELRKNRKGTRVIIDNIEELKLIQNPRLKW